MILSENEINQLNQSIVNAEKTTTGEIVPVIVSRSDDYPGAAWRLSIAFALLVGFALTLIDSKINALYLLMSFFPSLAIGLLLSKISLLLRGFTFPAKIEEEVTQRAFQAFFEHQIGSTQGKTGILIFISLFEHRVVILADQAINQKVPQGTWDQLVSKLTAEIKNKNLTSGLQTAIQMAGEILTKHFPGDSTNPNELPNQISIED